MKRFPQVVATLEPQPWSTGHESSVTTSRRGGRSPGVWRPRGRLSGHGSDTRGRCQVLNRAPPRLSAGVAGDGKACPPPDGRGSRWSAWVGVDAQGEVGIGVAEMLREGSQISFGVKPRVGQLLVDDLPSVGFGELVGGGRVEAGGDLGLAVDTGKVGDVAEAEDPALVLVGCWVTSRAVPSGLRCGTRQRWAGRRARRVDSRSRSDAQGARSRAGAQFPCAPGSTFTKYVSNW